MKSTISLLVKLFSSQTIHNVSFTTAMDIRVYRHIGPYMLGMHNFKSINIIIRMKVHIEHIKKNQNIYMYIKIHCECTQNFYIIYIIYNIRYQHQHELRIKNVNKYHNIYKQVFCAIFQSPSKLQRAQRDIKFLTYNDNLIIYVKSFVYLCAWCIVSLYILFSAQYTIFARIFYLRTIIPGNRLLYTFYI